MLKELPAKQISQRRLDALPHNYMLIQLSDPAGAAGGQQAGRGKAPLPAKPQQLVEPPGCPAGGAVGWGWGRGQALLLFWLHPPTAGLHIR